MSEFGAADVLRKAASRVEQEGMWCQDDAFAWPQKWVGKHTADEAAEFDIPACALGSLAIAEYQLTGNVCFMFTDLQNAAMDALSDEVGVANPAWWNDEPGRTAHEVAEAMRLAADRIAS